MDKLDILIDRIIKREGEYVEDSGGPTKYGVTKAAYEEFLVHKEPETYSFDTVSHQVTVQDMKNLSIQDAKSFYNWYLVKNNSTDKISDPYILDILYDSFTNHGVSRSTKWVQAFVNTKQDGVLGPITAKAVQNLTNHQTAQLYMHIFSERLTHYVFLTTSNPDKYLQYLKGWINRLKKFIR